jgi:uncharacterized protein YjbI with pentapeptide repeats
LFAQRAALIITGTPTRPDGHFVNPVHSFVPDSIVLALICAMATPWSAHAEAPAGVRVVELKAGKARTDATSSVMDGRSKQPGKAAGKIQGVFRGDWGLTLTYRKSDLVIHEDAKYLSLKAHNKGLVPAAHPEAWKLVKDLADQKGTDCDRPSPSARMGKCELTKAGELAGRDLKGADLTKAKLAGDLDGTDLSGANLSGATVQGGLTIKPSTRLTDANLSGLYSDGNNRLTAAGADLSGTRLDRANLYGADFKGARLERANLSGAALTGANLSQAALGGADLNHSDLTFADLSTGSLSGARLREADLTQANLSGADLSSANLQQANLAGANLAGIDLRGADLSSANFTEATGADTAQVDAHTDFTSATCPDGVAVDGSAVTTCIGHGF